MADNTVGVRDYLGQLIGSGNVGYDEQSKGVTATIGGKTYNLGNSGMTLDNNGSYQADGSYLNGALKQNSAFSGSEKHSSV